MWFIVATIFIVLAIKKLVAGSIFAFLVFIVFAWFAVFLNRSGMDLT